MSNIVVIPARGGSVGIPRKNVSLLRGKPLLSYVIEAALHATKVGHVVVSTDDDEIQHIAESYGVAVVRRGPELCAPDTTLDSVVQEAVAQEELRTGCRYDPVLTIQPTSPLITGHTIDAALERFRSEGSDTLVTVCDGTHLSWTKGDAPGVYRPNYTERLNRQYLPKVYRENGAIVICKRSSLATGSRFGERVTPFVMEEIESVDIDSRLDWMLCEKILDMLRIVFVITGNAETGTGHVHRCLNLAENLVSHQLTFLCLPGSELAYRMIRARHFNAQMLSGPDLAAEVLSYNPHMAINDALDTAASYVSRLKDAGVFVVNFEDDGPGSDLADVVINALYEAQPRRPNCYYGQEYYCLRTEFLLCGEHPIRPRVERVLLTYGGTDPSHLTCKTLKAIDGLCAQHGIEIVVVTGPGYMHRGDLDELARNCQSRCRVVQNVKVMSSLMQEADVCFTSCGRTVYEVAAVGVPTIAMAQNDRETRHAFIRPANGICYLGLGSGVDENEIRAALNQLIHSVLLRTVMKAAMKGQDLSRGTRNVCKLIFDHYEKSMEQNSCSRLQVARSAPNTSRTLSLKLA